MKRKVIITLLLLCLIAGICYYISLPDYMSTIVCHSAIKARETRS